METKSDVENFKITGDWSIQSTRLKAKYTQLTDEDLKFETGKESELLGRVETKLDKKRDEVITLIRENETQKS